MKNLICILLLALLSTIAVAQERPTWAFPRSAVDEHGPEPEFDPDKVWNLTGSKLSLTRKQTSNFFNAPNWFPDMYPPMPRVVQYGDEDRGLRACALCHLPTGTGHDESAYIAGLPVEYFIRQMKDYKTGDRVGSGGSMIAIAGIINDEEIRAAAEYYAKVKPRRWIQVVEMETVPKTYVANGNRRIIDPDGGTEPIGNRILAVPLNVDFALLRDPRTGFVAFVPPGSIDRGRELVTTGGEGKTIACNLCHGRTLHGKDDVPPLAGRHPNYIVRQMWNIKYGDRQGPHNAIMKPVVEFLNDNDMLAIGAYIGSLDPFPTVGRNHSHGHRRHHGD